ncbi:hypothetical protein [Rhizorhabdus sp. FW153]|uniref:hypothetical protein n=1 Tax=Rhizorhabdus sp. FW153 TaxID=3400216 RepID=UPI003CF1087E
MHRVRIGITGLAVVFLIVLFAAAIVGFRSRDRSEEANLASAANSSAPSGDPLAELGVAPGGTSGESQATQPQPARP